MLLHAFVHVCTPLTGAPAEASLARERESDSGENERQKKKERPRRRHGQGEGERGGWSYDRGGLWLTSSVEPQKVCVVEREETFETAQAH